MGYALGIKWNDELIATEIYKVMKSLNIDRMPSNQEIKIVTKNNKLANAIRRHGGFYYWADKLGIPVKECETKLGKKYESILKKYMETQGWEAEQMGARHPYDLLINENIKIDVKASKRYYYSDQNYYYTFNLEKKNPTCDIYVCFCLDDNEGFDKVLIIPSKFLHKTQLSIGIESIYDKYIDRWDLIDKYNEFYRKLA
jgi:hypothetical protein